MDDIAIPRAIVYFDGFNFYNGCFKNGDRPVAWTRFKWLDLGTFCNVAFPGYQIELIRYFTATLKDLPHDPDAKERQAEYLRALGTIPGLTVHLGRFYIHAKWRYVADPRYRKKEYVVPHRQERVIIPEEKGSDVNLASHLIADGFRGDYDTAIVVSNDSDLAEPISIVCNELGKPVVLMNPHLEVAWHLQRIGGVHYRPVRIGTLAISQFPVTMNDADGIITKPASW